MSNQGSLRSLLKIISVNVNSIVTNKRRDTLNDLLKTQKPDIVLLGETKLNKNHKMTFTNYSMVRTDRRNAIQGGGTGLLIKNNLQYDEICLSGLSDFSTLELTGICLRLPEGNKIHILAAYSAQSRSDVFAAEWEALFRVLNLADPRNFYLIAGDLNAKHSNWLNEVQNTRGTFMSQWILDNQMVVRCRLLGPSMMTYPRGRSYLDICIADSRLNFRLPSNVVVRNDDANNQAFVSQLRVLPYDSDHNAIEIVVGYTDDEQFVLRTREDPPRLVYNRTSWPRFARQVDRKCSELVQIGNNNLSNSDIDREITKLDEIILDTINTVVPKSRPASSTDCYITPAIKALKRQKSQLISALFVYYRSNEHNFQSDPGFILIKSLIKNVQVLLKQQFKNSSEQYWRDKIKGITKKDTHMFPNINRIFRKKSHVTIPALQIQHDDGILRDAGLGARRPVDDAGNVLLASDAEKLSVLGTYFEGIHRQNGNLSNLETQALVDRTVTEFEITNPRNNNPMLVFDDDKCADNLSQEQTLNHFTTFENLRTVFDKLNNKKSSGIDGIPNLVLKHLPDVVVRRYCVLFNNALNNSYFPRHWKRARVFPIGKKNKDLARHESYRPISLLPNIGKVFEVLINQKLQAFCDTEGLMPDCQFGFRRFHSTVHAISKFTSDCCWHLNAKKCIGACLIDLEKAFDTVWQAGLIYKLINFNFPPRLITIISDMISDRSFVVTNGDCTTERVFTIADGLQQGTVNSPLLFNIYTCDLPRSYNFNADAGKQLIAFADDIIIYAADKKVDVIQRKLQSSFDEVLSYMHRWKLRVNSSKCETILFRTPLSKASRNVKKHWKNLRICPDAERQHPVEQKTLVRYLGVHIDQYLYYTDHLAIQVKKATNAFMLLKRLFFSRHLSADIKLICYKALVRPLLTYGAPIWFNVCPSYMERLRVLERKALRSCTGRYRTGETNYLHMVSNRMLYNFSDIDRIDSFIIGLIRNHIARTSQMTDNDYVYQLYYQNDLYLRNTLMSGHVPPEAFLYLDREGYMQDGAGIPMIYHIYRRPTDKTIQYRAANVDPSMIRFNTSMPDNRAADRPYWWHHNYD